MIISINRELRQVMVIKLVVDLGDLINVVGKLVGEWENSYGG
jgi:hypothetical protein